MSKLHVQALNDLLRRYGRILRDTWQLRHQLDSPPRLKHEVAFLPAHLELAEAPAHPVPKWTMRVLAVLSILVFAIAVFGRLDIVITAKGRLVPTARVKVIQPAITGVVRTIAVRDGQRVKQGDLLLELDPTQAEADADKARTARLDAALAAARAEAVIAAISTGATPQVSAPDGVAADRKLEAQQLADRIAAEYRSRRESSRSELARRQAELTATRQQIAKLAGTAPIARAQANDYRDLAQENYVARHEYLAKEQTAIEQEHELLAQRAHATQLAAAIEQQRHELTALAEQATREQLDLLDRAKQQLAQASGDQTKAETRQALMRMTAPVDGTVQKLATHTVGGVVTTAQALLTIVPDDLLEVEATVENKDIGFIELQQDATIKIDAFPYTRYGLLNGRVIDIPNDAAQDKKLGLTFPVRIAMPEQRITVGNRDINLSPGMQVTVDIRTGRQSVLSYFLSPLVATTKESMRER